MASRSRPLLVVLLAVALAAFVTSCGGGSGNDKSATQLLDTAFHQPIKSADVNFSLQVQVNGVASVNPKTAWAVRSDPGKNIQFSSQGAQYWQDISATGAGSWR